MEPQVLEYIYIQHRHMAMAGRQAGRQASLSDVLDAQRIEQGWKMSQRHLELHQSRYIHGETEQHLLAIRLKSTICRVSTAQFNAEDRNLVRSAGSGCG